MQESEDVSFLKVGCLDVFCRWDSLSGLLVTVIEPAVSLSVCLMVQLVDVGQKIVAHRINGYLVGRILLLLANIHIQPRPIWFSRHGESQFNASGRIGGDSPLR